jgi:hypothetical protein
VMDGGIGKRVYPCACDVVIFYRHSRIACSSSIAPGIRKMCRRVVNDAVYRVLYVR